MEPFWLGYAWDWQTGRAGKPVVYSDNRHVTMMVRPVPERDIIEIPNLLRLGGRQRGGGRSRCDSVFNVTRSSRTVPSP